jgi:hypothetical protein
MSALVNRRIRTEAKRVRRGCRREIKHKKRDRLARGCEINAMEMERERLREGDGPSGTKVVFVCVLVYVECDVGAAGVYETAVLVVILLVVVVTKSSLVEQRL